MLYKFDTDSMKHAKAALLLYAMYKSRSKNSPLNGLETWTHFETFTRAACIKSSTTAEFVQAFCQKAKIDSIKPRYLDTGEPVKVGDSGALVYSDAIKDYRLNIIADDQLLELFTKESIYLILLVRERIQREQIEFAEDEEDEEDQD